MAALKVQPRGHRQQPEAEPPHRLPQAPAVPRQGRGKGEIPPQDAQSAQGDGEIAGMPAVLQGQPQPRRHS